jgi:hypothetical protein
MKQAILGLVLAVAFLAGCAPKEPTPEMLFGVWQSDTRSLTFREFKDTDKSLPKVVSNRDQNGVVLIESEPGNEIEAVWWLSEKGMLIISVLETIEIEGLGSSSTRGYMYGIEELTEDTLVIWPITGGEKVLDEYTRRE